MGTLKVVTVDPSNVKHIIATSFNQFEKGEKFHDMLEGFLGTGIFNSDGDTWKLTFLDYLVTVSNDPSLIRDSLISFLLAGRDTTASLLTFIIYVLALHPDVCNQLAKEINETVCEDRLCTFEEIKSMRYLRATINETLRLFPPVPFNIRRSTSNPSILPSNSSEARDGLFLYPRCSVTYSLLHIHRRKDIWGEDAEDFKPERWLADDSKRVHVTNPFAFLPFNGGPRMVKT
ncbi:unnamed protein product [Rhizoctonia solani]|uniref:Cytochrome P450 n=1 Tax=Rhizoctonia solani TaxID=456999 RepID=A0A8H3DU02_9AGAM|nr:unnamed protein product [Rhizoctonia solani]